MIELKKTFSKFSPPPHVRRFLTLVRVYKLELVVALICMVLSGAVSSALAKILGFLTDVGFYQKESWVIAATPVALIGTAVIFAVTSFLSNHYFYKINQNITADFRKQIFQKMLRWPESSYIASNAGRLSSTFILEANFMLMTVSKSAVIFVRDLFQILFLSAMLFWVNWKLALLAVIVLPLFYVLITKLNRLIKTQMSKTLVSIPEVVANVRETFEGERFIKSMNAYDQARERFQKVNTALKEQAVLMVKAFGVVDPLTQTLSMTMVAVVLTVALYLTQQGIMSIGDMVTFLSALMLLTPPLRSLSSFLGTYIQLDLATKTIFDLIDSTLEPDDGKEPFVDKVDTIRFDNVELVYPDTTDKALDAINLTVKAGETIAIVGSTGAGKSTLVNLLPRFWLPTAGAVRINDIDINQFELSALRRNISMVKQDVILFNTTVRENVAYGTGITDDQLIWKALEEVNLRALIEQLPEGLDTHVGSLGDSFSGGERQRILIARLLLKDAPILILDEATSALDAENERLVAEAMGKLQAGRTTFVIAHRLTSVKNADRIVVMDHGRIVETGTWAELASREGEFANLLSLQALK